MIHTLDDVLGIIKKTILTNRKRGQTTNLIVRDDGVKGRIGDQVLRRVVVVQEEIKWK